MKDKDYILHKIKEAVKLVEPTATIILFGSYARNNYKKDSDIDILILLEKDIITRIDEKKIKYPLYEIEFNTGTIISPIVLSKKDWERRHSITPFYENIVNEGKIV